MPLEGQREASPVWIANQLGILHCSLDISNYAFRNTFKLLKPDWEKLWRKLDKQRTNLNLSFFITLKLHCMSTCTLIATGISTILFITQNFLKTFISLKLLQLPHFAKELKLIHLKISYKILHHFHPSERPSQKRTVQCLTHLCSRLLWAIEWRTTTNIRCRLKIKMSPAW